MKIDITRHLDADPFTIWEAEEYWPDDIDRVVEEFAAQGYEVTRQQAVELWSWYASIIRAQWISTAGYEPGEVFAVLERRGFFREAQS